MLIGLNATASFVGRRMSDSPQFKDYAREMAALPLFDGDLRGMQFHSEAWIGGNLRAWDMDFWSVCTDEGEMLLHIVANRTREQAKGTFSGFSISNFRIIQADGRVVAVGSDVVLPQ
jgi:hypothetical protein